MKEGLVGLIRRRRLRHLPGHVDSPAASGENRPDRNQTERRGTGNARSVATAMIHLDFAWLVWSITGSDHEARRGGIGPDPAQLLAFRYASLAQDPDIGDDMQDVHEPTQEETLAAEA
eukprot:2851103-Pyramimonas_sp.AAC.1